MSEAKPLKVLFIGNSHTYFHDLPQVFKMLAEAGQDRPVEARLLAFPGVPWSWHLSQETMVRYEFLFGGYDYVVLQQAAHRPFPEPEKTLRDGKILIERARENGIKPIVCVSWAERRAPQHQQPMFDVAQKLAAEHDVPLEPTGYLFQQVAAEHPEIDLFYHDGEHCGPYGTYLRALSIYRIVFGESPVGLPAKSMCNALIDEELAAKSRPVLQKVVTEEAELDAWIASDEFQTVEDTMWATYSLNWDKDSCYVDLDPGKAKTLQELVEQYFAG